MNKNILGPSEYFLRLMVLSRVEVNRGMSVMLDLLLWSRLWTGGYPGPLVKPSPMLYYTLLSYIHWSDPPSPPPLLLASPYLLHQLIATAIATPIVLTLSIPKDLKNMKSNTNATPILFLHFTFSTQGTVFLSLYRLSLCLLVF